MHIKRADQSIIPNISHRALLVELLADSHWRAEVKAQDPNAFIVPFVTSVPNFDYNAYLSSPTWEAIRQTKLKAAGYQCETGCGRRAREVHHRDYRPRVLSGEDLTPLVALCTECHQVVEQDDRAENATLGRIRSASWLSLWLEPVALRGGEIRHGTNLGTMRCAPTKLPRRVWAQLVKRDKEAMHENIGRQKDESRD